MGQGASACPEFSSIECSICMESSLDFRVLKCEHSFCRLCLERLVKRHPKSSLICPTCRDVTPNLGVKDIAFMPKVQTVKDFSEKVDALLENGEKKSYKVCDECKQYAKYSCLQCWAHFCEKCFEKHEKLELSGHRLYQTSVYMFCDIHYMKQVQNFCRTCHQRCCLHCMLNQHKGHDIEDVDAAASKVKDQISELSQKLKHSGSEEKRCAEIDAQIKQTENAQEKFKTSVGNLRNQLNKMLENLDMVDKEITATHEAQMQSVRDWREERNQYKASKALLTSQLSVLSEQASSHEVIGHSEAMTSLSPAPRFEYQLTADMTSQQNYDVTLNDITDSLVPIGRKLEWKTFSTIRSGTTTVKDEQDGEIFMNALQEL